MPSRTPPTTRMPAADRRELVLAAATHAFAQHGYAGTSTDAVAREAGVSQPYVVRIFGSKLELFLEVLDHAIGAIDDAFLTALAAQPFDPTSDEDWERLGHVYTALVQDRDLVRVMMHGFSSGGIEEIGVHARAGMGRIWATLKATGADDERAMNFISHGMLLNVMLLMGAAEHLDDEPALAALALCAGLLKVAP